MSLLWTLASLARAQDCPERLDADTFAARVAALREPVALAEPSAQAALQDLFTLTERACFSAPIGAEPMASLHLAQAAYLQLSGGDPALAQTSIELAAALGAKPEPLYGPSTNKALAEAAQRPLPQGQLELTFEPMPDLVMIDGEMRYDPGPYGLFAGPHLVQWSIDGVWGGQLVTVQEGELREVGEGPKLSQESICPDLEQTLLAAELAYAQNQSPADPSVSVLQVWACTQVPRRQASSLLARLWLLDGATALRQGDMAWALLAMGAASALDDQAWSAVYGAEVRAVWDAARGKDVGRGTLRLSPEPPRGWLRIDGQEAKGAQTLAAGPHLVELREPGQDAVFLRTVRVLPNEEQVLETGLEPIQAPPPREGPLALDTLALDLWLGAGGAQQGAPRGEGPEGWGGPSGLLGLGISSPAYKDLNLWLNASGLRTQGSAAEPAPVRTHMAQLDLGLGLAWTPQRWRLSAGVVRGVGSGVTSITYVPEGPYAEQGVPSAMALAWVGQGPLLLVDRVLWQPGPTQLALGLRLSTIYDGNRWISTETLTLRLSLVPFVSEGTP